eukprot:7075260-Pyramimonas_sp.AAC.1
MTVPAKDVLISMANGTPRAAVKSDLGGRLLEPKRPRTHARYLSCQTMRHADKRFEIHMRWLENCQWLCGNISAIPGANASAYPKTSGYKSQDFQEEVTRLQNTM